MKKKLIILAIAITIIFSLSACNKTSKVSDESKISVVVSFNPLREFASAIGKDKIVVTTVIPDGTEPHDFEPKARDIMNINNSKIFVYNGLGMETWIDKVMGIINSKDIIIVDASSGCNTIASTDTANNRGQFDPHIWLSPREAKIESYNIKEALVKADPKNKEFYNKNYEAFGVRLDKIYNVYSKKMNSLKNKNFVTGHAAFAYLCRDFNLKQNSVEDVFAEGEPSAKRLSELVNYCKANNIKTIFTENMVSPRISETLAKEIGGKAVKIYTIESKEDNKDYIKSMEDNLNKIYNSLAAL